MSVTESRSPGGSRTGSSSGRRRGDRRRHRRRPRGVDRDGSRHTPPVRGRGLDPARTGKPGLGRARSQTGGPRRWSSPRPGVPGREDDEYTRHGMANRLVVVEPRAGTRRVTVTDRRTAADFAAQMVSLCDDLYPQADVIRVALDDRSPHTFGSRFAASPPGVAAAAEAGIPPHPEARPRAEPGRGRVERAGPAVPRPADHEPGGIGRRGEGVGGWAGTRCRRTSTGPSGSPTPARSWPTCTRKLLSGETLGSGAASAAVRTGAACPPSSPPATAPCGCRPAPPAFARA